MKKTLLAIGAVLALTNVDAQLFTENWTTPQTWGIAQGPTDMDTLNWGVGTVSSFSAQGNMAISNSWVDDGSASGVALTPDNFLISPNIDMSAVTGSVSLSFKVGSPEPTASNFYQEYISVYVLNSVNDLATATPIHSAALAGGEQMYTFNYDITSMAAGEDTVMLVFRHHNCTDENFIMLDDINVTNGGLGINEAIVEASVFPNPANEVLNIVTTEELAEVRIMTADGKVAFISATSNVNVADLRSGMYLYEAITVSGKVARGNFVKN
ncbi:MAG TPA: choice-of-anchor J domain-containing protein [Fluviicola sp.]|nr:choice-of-anchor J domain-containing protein [Fluviicola sp.]